LTGVDSEAGYRPLAVDPVTGAVYVGDGSEVAEYNSAGVLQLMFGSTEPLGGSLGKIRLLGAVAIAVNGVTGRVYVANALHGDVDVFGARIGPPVVEGQQPAAANVSVTSALIGGNVNPGSGGGATFYLEYVDGEEYEPADSDPYRAGGSTVVTALPGSDAVEATPMVALTGLSPGRTYDYRLVVTNAAETTYGPNETFTTAAATPPVAMTGPAGEVSATGVTLTGTVDPRGLATSYVFEVGTDTTYGGTKLFGAAGSGTGEVTVSVGLQYLVPGTTYHYRLSATSFDGTSYGQDGTFTTPGVPSPIVQPTSTALIASPSVQFPSIVGAITRPLSTAKPKKKQSESQKLAGALRTCRKQRVGERRASCEARARKRYEPAGKSNKSKKR
jgi:hypothetical protein